MSKIYSMFKDLKKENNEIIYLFKNGIFYIAIAEDAQYLSKEFGFKLTNLNDNIVKCGFPVSSLDKYYNLFKLNNINFKLINSADKNSNISDPNNDEIFKFINKLSNVDTESLSVLEIYNFLENVKSEAIKIKRQF